MDKRVYYHDTDAGGVVYYANYLKYMEEARTEFLEERGLSVKTFQERGLAYAVRTCQIAYRRPARYGDDLIVTAELTKVTAVQLFFRQTVIKKATQEILVEADIGLACLNQDFKPAVLPEDLKDRLTSPSSAP